MTEPVSTMRIIPQECKPTLNFEYEQKLDHYTTKEYILHAIDDYLKKQEEEKGITYKDNGQYFFIKYIQTYNCKGLKVDYSIKESKQKNIFNRNVPIVTIHDIQCIGKDDVTPFENEGGGIKHFVMLNGRKHCLYIKKNKKYIKIPKTM